MKESHAESNISVMIMKSINGFIQVQITMGQRVCSDILSQVSEVVICHMSYPIQDFLSVFVYTLDTFLTICLYSN